MEGKRKERTKNGSRTTTVARLLLGDGHLVMITDDAVDCSWFQDMTNRWSFGLDKSVTGMEIGFQGSVYSAQSQG